MKIAHSLLVAVAAAGLLLVGCGESLDLTPASGTVTYKGQPVDGAIVAFTPAKGPPGTAKTDAAGKYTIMTNGQSGAVAGNNTVTVTKVTTSGPDMTQMKPEDMQKMASAGTMPTSKSAIPTKYSAPQGGLKADVSAAKPTHDFELTD